jgi:hypothetical protein
MLVAAAAAQWQAKPGDCRSRTGRLSMPPRKGPVLRQSGPSRGEPPRAERAGAKDPKDSADRNAGPANRRPRHRHRRARYGRHTAAGLRRDRALSGRGGYPR